MHVASGVRSIDDGRPRAPAPRCPVGVCEERESQTSRRRAPVAGRWRCGQRLLDPVHTRDLKQPPEQQSTARYRDRRGRGGSVDGAYEGSRGRGRGAGGRWGSRRT